MALPFGQQPSFTPDQINLAVNYVINQVNQYTYQFRSLPERRSQVRPISLIHFKWLGIPITATWGREQRTQVLEPLQAALWQSKLNWSLVSACTK